LANRRRLGRGEEGAVLSQWGREGKKSRVVLLLEGEKGNTIQEKRLRAVYAFPGIPQTKKRKEA